MSISNNFFLGIDKDLQGVAKSAKSTYQGLASFGKLSTEFDNLSKSSNKFLGNLVSLKNTAVGIGSLGLGFASLAVNIGTVITITNKAKDTFKEFKNVAKGLTFAEAISGSQELADNINDLGKTKDVFTRLKLYSDSLFDTRNVEKWSAKSIAAYAQVEQAAYRLSTITVSGNERSIDALNKNIKLMRDLQQATDFAVDSVSLLNTQYDIASAGFTSNKDLQQVGKSSINLSQAGFGDVGGSTNAIVRVLRALGEESDSAEKRASQLFETTKVGLLTLNQLTSEIGSLAVSSKQLGVDFEEVSAALAGMTTKGISAGEATTQLEALFAEITMGSDEANKILSNFRDNAGKPIQLNLTSLKEKGLKGLIDDLKSASKGDASFIQQIFSTKEAQNATKVLFSLGDDFENFTDRIKNASSAGLESEAKNRSQTLSGAYSKAFNESQKGVEEFGAGLSPSALESLLSVNNEVAKLANAGAEATGKTVGFLTTIAIKAKAVGDFLGTVFITLFPLAVFNTIIANFGKIKASFMRDGETIQQAIKRNFTQAVTFAKSKFDALITYIVAKVKQLNSTPIILDVRSSSAGNFPGTSALNQKALPSASSASKSIATRKDLSTDSLYKTIDVIPTQIDKITSTATSKTNSLFGGIKNVAGGALGFIGSSLKSLGAMMVGLAITGAALGAAIAYITSTFDNLSKIVNRKSIPELQEMRDTVKDLSNIDGIQGIVDKFDISKGVSSTNDELSITEDILNRIGGIWNTITFSTMQYKIINEEIVNTQEKLKKEIQANDEAAKAGELRAKSPEAKAAEAKIKANIDLDSDDKAALELETKKKIQAVDANIALQKQRIKAFEAKGNKDENTLNTLRNELRILEKQSEEQKKQIQLQLTKVELQSGLNKLNSISTVIPLQLQLSSNKEEALKAQIQDIVDTFSDSLSGEITDTSAEKFKSIKNKIGATLKGIQAQVDVDPNSALKLRQQLEKNLGVNLTKLFIANPELRELSAQVNKAISEGISKSTQLKDVANTSLFDSAESAGSNSTLLSALKYKQLLSSISNQVSTLNAELSKPETSLARQEEILAEIAQLESKRLSLNIENSIKQELTARKQTLTLSQELLNIDQSRLSLLNQENKFNLFSISAAQAKLTAAEKELQVKKESLAVSNREEEIKKEKITEAIKAKTNSSDLEKTSTNKNKSTNVASVESQRQINTTRVGAEISNLTKKSQEKISIIAQQTKDKVAEIESNRFNFSGNNGNIQKETIVQAVKSIIVSSKDGQEAVKNLNIEGLNSFDNDESFTKKIESSIFKDGNLQNSDYVRKLLLQNISSPGAIQASNILEQKNLDTALDKQKAKRLGRDKTAEESNNLSSTIAQLKSNLEKQNSQIKAAAQNREQVQNLLGTNTGSVTKDSLDSKAINRIKEVTSNFDSVLKVSSAQIEVEFASRAKLIQQNESLSNTFSQIASNTEIFGTSLASASLDLASKEIQNPNARVNLDSDKALKQISSTQQLRETLVDELNSTLASAIKAGVSPDKIKEITKARDTAVQDRDLGKEESVIDTNNVKQQTSVLKLNNDLQESASRIRKEFAARELLTKGMERVSGAFSNFASGLSGVIGSILPNSSFAAKINTKAVTAKESIDSINRENNKEKEFKLLESRLVAIDKVVASSKQNNVDPKIIKALENSKQDVSKEVDLEKKTIEQVNSIENATGRLNIFSAKLNESNAAITENIDVINKQMSNYKDLIDLQQRQKEVAATSNKSGTSLQTSLLGFLSKNNPVTEMLQQRIDFKQANEDATLEKSRNITDAKKEIIDTTIQKAQLTLEQQNYENALTQTALLSDLINVTQGKEASFSSSDIIKDSISNITSKINQTREINKERLGILDEKLKFIPTELSAKNESVDRERLAKQGGLLSNLMPSNFDLQRQYLLETESSLKNFKRKDITTGSLEDADFKDKINRINSISGLTSSKELNTLQSYSGSKPDRSNTENSINAPIKININITGNETINKGNLENQISSTVSKQVNNSLRDLSKQLLNAVSR